MLIKDLDLLNLSPLSPLEALVFENHQVGLGSHNSPCGLSRLYLGICMYMHTVTQEVMSLKESTEW